MRIIGAALLAFILAACSLIPEAERAAPPAQSVRDTAVIPPAPPVTPAPTPVVPARTDFTLKGEFEQGGWIRGRAPSGAVSVTLDDAQLPLAQDGSFFAAFDRDADNSAHLSATLADGRVIAHDIRIVARAWDIEHIDIARHPSGPSEAFLRIRRPELAAIGAARAVRSNTDGWRQHFIWPVTGRISGRFGAQRIYRGEPGSYHTGIDITSGEAGTPFVAPADGVVVLVADDFSLEGSLLIIDHGMGLNSAFLHASRLYVKEGERVRQGQHIGDIGSSGRATGPHLHWSLKWRDARLDPLLFTGPMP